MNDLGDPSLVWSFGYGNRPTSTTLTVINIDDVITPDHWGCADKQTKCCRNLNVYQSNVRKALASYASYNNLESFEEGG